MICLSSAGSLTRFEVKVYKVESQLERCLHSKTVGSGQRCETPRRRSVLITSRVGTADPTNSFRRSWLQTRPATKTSKVQAFPVDKPRKVEGVHDTQTGAPLGIPRGARCVQRFDDSLNSAIHITYRISLRSSSMREPRDPLLKVVLIACDRKSKTFYTCINGLFV